MGHRFERLNDHVIVRSMAGRGHGYTVHGLKTSKSQIKRFDDLSIGIRDRGYLCSVPQEFGIGDGN